MHRFKVSVLPDKRYSEGCGLTFMRSTEEYFRQYMEAMDEVGSVMDMGRPFDERVRHPIAFASRSGKGTGPL